MKMKNKTAATMALIMAITLLALIRPSDAATTGTLTLTRTNGTIIHYILGNTNGDFTTDSATITFELNASNPTMSECKAYLTCEKPEINYQSIADAVSNSSLYAQYSTCIAQYNNATIALLNKEVDIKKSYLDYTDANTKYMNAQNQIADFEKNQNIWMLICTLELFIILLTAFLPRMKGFMDKNKVMP